ncbi:hypothetical protein EsH8_VII_000147 [Colletotrichum jinshuiense]
MAIRPSRRDEFEIAVVCALALEYNAVELAFDEFWDDDGDTYGRAQNDPNTYATGRIGQYNVVLALLPNMGKVSAASAAASLRSSYTGLRLVVLTGICGGVPNAGTDDEMLLGDVVISKTIVQYDLGRQYLGQFVRRDTLEDNPGRHSRDIRSLLATFETSRGRERLQLGALQVVAEMQEKAAKKRRRARYRRPPASEDRLFDTGYLHKHRDRSDCGCGVQACEAARAASCDELRCDEARLVPRERLDEVQDPASGEDETFEIFVGSIGSADTVMKSGADRDRIAREHGVIALEMEGAGVWDEACIVVKGVCDYADSHKNKKWQAYAALTAASVMKALLARYIRTDRPADNNDNGDNNGNGSNGGDDGDDGRGSGGSNKWTGTPSGGGSGPVFHGPISGKYVIAGLHTTGGTTNMNFGT